MQYDVTDDSDHRIYMKVHLAAVARLVALTCNYWEINGEVAL